MSRLAIAFLAALAATAANAQTQSQTPLVTTDGSRPFLFDGRMKGDGERQPARVNDHRSNAGAVVMPAQAKQPASKP